MQHYWFIFACFYLMPVSLPGIDTLLNYTALEAYTGNADTIYIDHPRYHGIFVRSDCEQEDFGTTVFNRTDCWQRIHRNFHPRFWEIGGRSPDNRIGQILREIDAINSASVAAYWRGGDTIEIDSLYEIDRPVFLFNHNTYLGTRENAGFIRINPPKTVLTDTAKVGDKMITVASTVGFRTYQLINIANGQAFDEIAGFQSYTASVSDFNPDESTILLSGLPIQKQMLPGDSVSLFFPMMRSMLLTLDSIHIKELLFNGRREVYTLNYDWRVNGTIPLATSQDILIEKCRFEAIPVENVFLCGATMIDCTGAGLNGSAVHFSCNEGDYPTNILYNQFFGLNEVGDSLMEHSEAGMTFSAKVRNLRVAYNVLESIEEDGIGTFANDDGDNEITDNLLDTDGEMISFGPLYNQQATNLIYNNKNPRKGDRSSESCLLRRPEILGALPCRAGSSVETPLMAGDTITVVLDSLQFRNSNENFVKAFVPIYDQTYFDLTAMSISTPALSKFHSWSFGQLPSGSAALIFDNGHRAGTFGLGNWGYGPCGEAGGCRELTMTFVVNDLPDTIQAVNCPLEAVEIMYDGEFGTWGLPIACDQEALEPDLGLLGSPVLAAGSPSFSRQVDRENILRIYPNPAGSKINLDLPASTAVPYRLFNAWGQLIQRGKYFNTTIPIDHLAPGTYSILLWDGKQTFSAFFTKI